MNISSKDGKKSISNTEEVVSYKISSDKRIVVLSYKEANRLINFLEDEGVGEISFGLSSPETYNRFYLVTGGSDSFGVIEFKNKIN